MKRREFYKKAAASIAALVIAPKLAGAEEPLSMVDQVNQHRDELLDYRKRWLKDLVWSNALSMEGCLEIINATSETDIHHIYEKEQKRLDDAIHRISLIWVKQAQAQQNFNPFNRDVYFIWDFRTHCNYDYNYLNDHIIRWTPLIRPYADVGFRDLINRCVVLDAKIFPIWRSSYFLDGFYSWCILNKYDEPFLIHDRDCLPYIPGHDIDYEWARLEYETWGRPLDIQDKDIILNLMMLRKSLQETRKP